MSSSPNDEENSNTLKECRDLYLEKVRKDVLLIWTQQKNFKKIKAN